MPLAPIAPQQAVTGIPWLDALIGNPQSAMPGPAAISSPLRYVPMGAESGAPGWLTQAIRNVLSKAQPQMQGQPPAGAAVTQTVSPQGFAGKALENFGLGAADRIRPFSSPQAAPMHMQGPGGQTLPSEQLMGLMELLRQAAALSGRQ